MGKLRQITQLAEGRDLPPAIDKHLKFIFASNSKVAQTSIIRHALKRRALVKKDSLRRYAWYWKALKTKSILSNVFSFTVVRNPYDRTASAFYYLQKLGLLPYADFNEFCRLRLRHEQPETLADLDPHFHLQSQGLYSGAQCLIDFIGRLENIDRDWSYICRKAEIGTVTLPRENAAKVKTDCSAVYACYAKRLVSDLYRQDFERLGYCDRRLP